jgi:hypothetical protein
MYRFGHTPSPPYLRLSTALDDGAPAVEGAEAWTPTADLDVFFTQLYTLYFERGFPVFATRRVTSLLYVNGMGNTLRAPAQCPGSCGRLCVLRVACRMMGFTVVFVGVLAVCVDWSALTACAARNTCQVRLTPAGLCVGHGVVC